MAEPVIVDRKIENLTIGPKAWKKYLDDVEDMPNMTKEIKEFLKEPCPYYHLKKRYRTHIAMVIPKKFSVKIFQELQIAKNITNKCQYDNSSQIPEEKKVEEHYWIVITKKPIPHCENWGYEDSKQRGKNH